MDSQRFLDKLAELELEAEALQALRAFGDSHGQLADRGLMLLRHTTRFLLWQKLSGMRWLPVTHEHLKLYLATLLAGSDGRIRRDQLTRLRNIQRWLSFLERRGLILKAPEVIRPRYDLRVTSAWCP